MARKTSRRQKPRISTFAWVLIIVALVVVILPMLLPYLLGGGVILAVYLGSVFIDHQEKQLDHQYAPVLNPHPQYFFTIKGHMDKALTATMTPRFYASFQSSNDKCLRLDNWLEGAHGPRIVNKMYSNMDTNGNYFIKIPIDKYKPGMCGWMISEISESTIKDKKTAAENSDTVVIFGTHPDKLFNLLSVATYQCKNNNDCKRTKHTPFTKYSNGQLSYNHNYDYDINYLWRKK